ncbi:LIM domain-containing protein isoform X2 [Pungitius pungitius]
MSALYLSKVAPQDSTRSLLGPAQVQSAESGKRIKATKMAEESQPKEGDLPATPSSSQKPGPVDTSEAHTQPPASSQLSKQRLHQQRQKCELRRLLKHTHPELRMLDAAVDEELAEVLSWETGAAAAETGYEGEVLSRCLIFENSAPSNKVYPYAPMMHKVVGKVERRDVSKTSAVFEEQEERPRDGGDEGLVEDDTRLGSSPDPKKDVAEDMVRIDVQATKKIFESQYVDMSTLSPDNKFQGKVSISGDETGAVQKQTQEFELCNIFNEHNKNNVRSKCLDLTNPPNKPGPCVHMVGLDCDPEVSNSETVFENEPTSLLDPEELEEKIKTSAALLQNNPFIPTNIEREHPLMHTSKSQSPAGDSGAAQDYPITNVKDRTHLFESMPFDKIGHQSKDDIETMVENIKETLHTLYHGNCIHSDGSIIEVYETMIAKKAKFTLSQGGPEIGYDEVAEGGAQNFMLQLLPRANLKPHITYIKEASEGSMVATVVSVPVHRHHSTANQDTEFKTANVVQLVEDILNQDNSLQKGIVMQEDGDRCPEVIVYSLYNYFDKEDVKTYCPPHGAEYDEPEPEREEVRNTENKELRKGLIKSTISCLLETPQDQTYHESIRPEITVKGNVKLFKGCIEKGDLEYLKALQAEPTEQEQELPPNQTVSGEVIELHHERGGDQAEENSEWVPVDIKRLRNIFSGDQRPTRPKQNAWESRTQSAADCIHGEVKNSFGQCDGKTQEEAPKGSYGLETQDDGGVHRADPGVVDDKDDISNLQTATLGLQHETIEAKSDLKQTEPTWKKLPSTSDVTSEHKSDNQHENTERDTNSEEKGTTETRSKVGQKGAEVVHKQPKAATASVHSPETPAAQQGDEEVDFQGKLQAALDSLEKSNINVSRGDFRAAMIYRNTSRPQKERSENVGAASVEKPPQEEVCRATEPKSSQAPLRQQFSGEQVSAANAQPPRQSEKLNRPAASAVADESRRPVGPKPAVPPKPEHLKAKQRDARPANAKNPEETRTNPVRPEDTVPHPLAMTSASHRDEDKPSLFKTNAGADSGPLLADHQRNRLFDEAMHKSEEIEACGSVVILVSDNDNQNIELQQEINVKAEEKSPQDFPPKEDTNETDESHVDFNAACKKFGGKMELSAKIAPVKHKRVQIAQLDNTTPQNTPGNNSFLAYVGEEPRHTLSGPSGNDPKTFRQPSDSKEGKKMMQVSKVEMREKKVRRETEDERRQRLSVHMDEIMRGNATAAMEIVDNLRKQEELHSLLSRVEEIERDTSDVDVRSLRGVFENVPDWVVNSNNNDPTKADVEEQGGRGPLEKHSPESRSSMAHVFGDLERASEEVMTLKKQTLARLADVEEAIRKALYSVSTLKSDSDIAGLSCLFKESLSDQRGGPPTGSLGKISIGSSRVKPPRTRGSAAAPVSPAAKQRASPPSSPAFISIQSAARKADKSEPLPPETPIGPKAEEKFRTTKTLTCNSPAQNRRREEPPKGDQMKCLSAPKRELSVLEVWTDREGNSILGTKTVPEDYERNGHLEKGFYSSKTSNFVAGRPEDPTSAGQAAVGPVCHQITELPINQTP